MIDFSIIIPAYNLENCIEKTLESICRNTLDTTEIIVVNDGSRDDTAKVAKDYLTYNHVPHYEVISQENKGVSVARNAGIATAQGEYLIFCDGDDLCAKDMIEKIEAHKDTGSDMLVWRYDILQGEKRKVPQKGFAEKEYSNQTALKSFLLGDNKIRLGSFAVKKSLLEETGIRYTEGCAIAEDIEFIYKCLASAQTVRTMDDILYTYIKRDGSAMHQFSWKFFQAPAAVRRVYTYVRDNTTLFADEELEDYLHNGLYLLHAMFAFGSCIRYLNSWKEARECVNLYMVDYSDIESELQRISKEMKNAPTIFSKSRTRLFAFNRRLYVYYIFMRERK